MQRIALVALSILMLGVTQPMYAPPKHSPPASAAPTLWAPSPETPGAPAVASMSPPASGPPAADVAALSQAQILPPLRERAAALKAQIVQNPDSHPFVDCGCHFTADELDRMFIKKQVGYGSIYLRMQQETGICPLWNAAIDAAESGHFTALCAPNNVSGFGFDGRRYMSFDSIADCIAHKSRFLAAHYLTPGGRYYKGTTLSAVCHHYNGSAHWRELVVDVAYGMLTRGERA